MRGALSAFLSGHLPARANPSTGLRDFSPHILVRAGRVCFWDGRPVTFEAAPAPVRRGGPAGAIMVVVDDTTPSALRRWVTFRQPLLVRAEGRLGAWRARLAAAHGGLRGEALAEALRAEGVDAVVAVALRRGQLVVTEIIDLRPPGGDEAVLAVSPHANILTRLVEGMRAYEAADLARHALLAPRRRAEAALVARSAGVRALACGRDRCAFVLPDGTVAKVAQHARGRTANLRERALWMTAPPGWRGSLVPLLAADPSGDWLVMARAEGTVPAPAVEAILRGHDPAVPRDLAEAVGDGSNDSNWGYWKGRPALVDYA